MNNVIKMNVAHPLVGTWICADEDSSAEFTISPAARGLAVTGRDSSDGEAFVITDVALDGSTLSFTSLMPSTNHVVRHVLRPSAASMIEHEYTLREQWKRR